MKPRVVLLGLGGLSMESLQKLSGAGWLPNLSDILARRGIFPLDGPVPPFADAEWSILLSGADPGRTGFLEGWRKRPGSYFPEKANIQTLARRSEKSMLVFPDDDAAFLDVPLVAVLPGGEARHDAIRIVRKSRRGLWSEELFVSPFSCAESPSGSRSGKDSFQEEDRVLIERLTQKTILEGLALSRILENDVPRLVVCGFSALDRIISRFYQDIRLLCQGFDRPLLREPLRLFFRVLDEAVGQVFHRASSEMTVLAVSGHGYVPLRKSLSLNAFLLSRKDLFLRDRGAADFFLRKMVSPIVRGIGLRREPVRRMLERISLGRVVDRAGEPLSSEIGHIDWSRTRAFSLTRTGIYLNVRGSEPRGILSPGKEERAFGEEIIRDLKRLVDPETRQPVIRDVRWREELFDGPRTRDLPHLIVSEWDTSYGIRDWRSLTDGGSVFSKPENRSGSPVSSGFVCLSEPPDVSPVSGKIKIEQIAPSIRRILASSGKDSSSKPAFTSVYPKEA
ncbi:hypothetical protein [Leptospirillum ferriphilum]|uniref:Type I phosphodiesterase / nucleotide pyrophosphatase n=2 Tax=Leptospirillum ferriphilum TaxID=178606 RepID=A0A1V3SWA1_9BACT|nr:hypothetical protein [Leptospirillum ferriphilum]AFS53024.1 hypothetical protein LFML04_0790 [Leptospirillum ferriphilum ML-04]OOH73309.1 hypothetical protein BOX24_04430 [Leptospirillum ferriphilum]